ncbi:hypothetical protein [Mycolicibacterium sphagni]|uniref:hypothetical protein n=1 Tax=Mycolicibacterium sphagni TaxID=1786 RepID=UPI0021F2B896|nr:hypothetical protein [Mycolicibacterium sphagni]MCV7174776.1 hypothetical protein [Mycolicibacterium sphagni]
MSKTIQGEIREERNDAPFVNLTFPSGHRIAGWLDTRISGPLMAAPNPFIAPATLHHPKTVEDGEYIAYQAGDGSWSVAWDGQWLSGSHATPAAALKAGHKEVEGDDAD